MLAVHFFLQKRKKITPTNKLFEVAHHVWTKKKIKVISLYYSPPIFLVSILLPHTYIIHRKIPPPGKKINFFSDVIMYKTSFNQ